MGPVNPQAPLTATSSVVPGFGHPSGLPMVRDVKQMSRVVNPLPSTE